MNNRLSYSGLVDPRISESDKDMYLSNCYCSFHTVYCGGQYVLNSAHVGRLACVKEAFKKCPQFCKFDMSSGRNTL